MSKSSQMRGLLVVSLAVFLSGCGVDYESACAELEATREFESSKRMDIMKDYGLTPKEAEYFDSLRSLYRTYAETVITTPGSAKTAESWGERLTDLDLHQ